MSAVNSSWMGSAHLPTSTMNLSIVHLRHKDTQGILLGILLNMFLHPAKMHVKLMKVL